MRLIDGEEEGAYVERGIGEEREKAGRVDEELGRQPVGAHALEDDVVGLQRLLVHASRQGGVHALGQPLAAHTGNKCNLVHCANRLL